MGCGISSPQSRPALALFSLSQVRHDRRAASVGHAARHVRPPHPMNRASSRPALFAVPVRQPTPPRSTKRRQPIPGITWIQQKDPFANPVSLMISQDRALLGASPCLRGTINRMAASAFGNRPPAANIRYIVRTPHGQVPSSGKAAKTLVGVRSAKRGAGKWAST